MSWELFSEYLEFLCLDKVTSCQKVGQHKRLYDCIALPHDAIQYRNNEKLATVNSEYTVKWPTLRKKNTPQYIQTHKRIIWDSRHRPNCFRQSLIVWASASQHHETSRVLTDSEVMEEVWKSALPGSQLTKSMPIKAYSAKGFGVDSVGLCTWRPQSCNYNWLKETDLT